MLFFLFSFAFAIVVVVRHCFHKFVYIFIYFYEFTEINLWAVHLMMQVYNFISVENNRNVKNIHAKETKAIQMMNKMSICVCVCV